MPSPIADNGASPLAALDGFESLDPRLERAADALTRLAALSLEAPMAVISLIDGKRQRFHSGFGVALRKIPAADPFFTDAVAVDDMLVVADASQNPRFRDSPLVLGDPPVRFCAAVPLRTKEGLTLGALSILDGEPRPGLTPRQAEVLRDLAPLAVALIEALQGARPLHPVTGVPDGSRFLQDLDASLKDPARLAPHVAVLVVDAATPNQYVDLVRTLGYPEADSFEAAIAKRIGELLPEEVQLYHLATVRFACVVTADSADRLGAIIDDLAFNMQRPATYHDIPFATSVGIGVAYYPRDGAHAPDLMRAATSGAHESLDSEKAWSAYTPELDLSSRRAARLLRDIGPALASEGQLHLVYQPKVDLRTGRCVGAEALLRWAHPSLGPVGPGEFVGLIERTTLVHALTDWVLGTAMSQTARWRSAGLDLRISANVSMLDMGREHFAARLAELLDRHAVQPDWFNIEITESSLVRDLAEVRRQLDAVHRLGVAIEIDDFGAGQSTLSYLKYIPATFVKIDQLFVSRLAEDEEDRIMVRSTIDLVHALGRLVVAEGVVDATVSEWLRRHGCDIGQGEVFSLPLDAPGFERWLRTR